MFKAPPAGGKSTKIASESRAQLGKHKASTLRKFDTSLVSSSPLSPLVSLHIGFGCSCLCLPLSPFICASGWLRLLNGLLPACLPLFPKQFPASPWGGSSGRVAAALSPFVSPSKCTQSWVCLDGLLPPCLLPSPCSPFSPPLLPNCLFFSFVSSSVLQARLAWNCGWDRRDKVLDRFVPLCLRLQAGFVWAARRQRETGTLSGDKQSGSGTGEPSGAPMTC